MVMSPNLTDREREKFFEDSKEQTTVRTGYSDDVSGGSLPKYDTIDFTYPDNVTEVFTYSLSTVTVLTITVTYTNNSKQDLLSIVRS